MSLSRVLALMMGWQGITVGARMSRAISRKNIAQDRAGGGGSGAGRVMSHDEGGDALAWRLGGLLGIVYLCIWGYTHVGS